MNTIELEATKAVLAREILCMDDETMINNIRIYIKDFYPVDKQKGKSEKRKIGILDGIAKIVFKDDFEMTTEELLDLK